MVNKCSRVRLLLRMLPQPRKKLCRPVWAQHPSSIMTEIQTTKEKQLRLSKQRSPDHEPLKKERLSPWPDDAATYKWEYKYPAQERAMIKTLKVDTIPHMSWPYRGLTIGPRVGHTAQGEFNMNDQRDSTSIWLRSTTG